MFVCNKFGNYYSDTSPKCVDADGDKICDIPRVIEGSTGSVDERPSKVKI